MTSLPEGFIPHDGGLCPVALDSRPMVMFRDGSIESGWTAEFWNSFSSWWRWECEDHDSDIIAYKVETSNAD